jgi:hypothetical protein
MPLTADRARNMMTKQTMAHRLVKDKIYKEIEKKISLNAQNGLYQCEYCTPVFLPFMPIYDVHEVHQYCIDQLRYYGFKVVTPHYYDDMTSNFKINIIWAKPPPKKITSPFLIEQTHQQYKEKKPLMK